MLHIFTKMYLLCIVLLFAFAKEGLFTFLLWNIQYSLKVQSAATVYGVIKSKCLARIVYCE